MDDWWTHFWNEVGADFGGWPSSAHVLRYIIRLLIAALLGGVLGINREEHGKSAGLRTHMLVALGSGLFVLVGQQYGMTSADLSRVIQGIVTGIGFLGAGTIIKMKEEGQVRGLTTAASVWLATAVGIAAGMGQIVWAALGTLLALGILALVPKLEQVLGLK